MACLTLISLALSGTVCASQVCDSFRFTTPSFDMAGPQSDIAIEDLNSDGLVDLIAVNREDKLTVAFSRGNGLFSYPSIFDPLTGGSGDGANMAVGDIDGDGDLDVLAAIANANQIALYENNGDETFTPGVFADYNITAFVATADFNGDGHIDVAAMGDTTGEVHTPVVLFFNDGTGSSLDPIEYLVAPGSFTILPCDIDDDDDTDMVISASAEQQIQVLLNQGDGTFGIAIPITLPRESTSFTVGDVDGDGDLEILTYYLFADDVDVYLNQGSAIDDPPQRYFGGRDTTGVTLFDFDRDGNLDLLSSSRADSTQFVRLNDGSGNFGDLTPIADEIVFGLYPGDWSGDGEADVLALRGNFLAGSLITDEGIAQATTLDAGARTPLDVQLEDVNNDGNPDLISTSQVPGTIEIRLGDGSGSFLDPVITNIADGTRSFRAADLDGDGSIEIVVSVSQIDDPEAPIRIYAAQNDASTVLLQDLPAGDQPNEITIEDLNGDGLLDIATVGAGSISKLVVFLANGDGTFAQGVESEVWSEATDSLAFGDINHDGLPDASLVSRSGARQGVMENMGDGSFQWLANRTRPNSQLRDSIFGDIDGDGDLELIYAALGGLEIYPISDTGSLKDGSTLRIRSSGRLYFLDINGDDVGDIVSAARIDSDDLVSFLPGRRDGTFGPEQHYRVGFFPIAIAFGDVNNDGEADLVTANRKDDSYSVLLGRTSCFTSCPADINNDGTASPADFTAWLGCFNNPASQPFCDNADVNDSGSIEPADFTSWLAAFNNGCP